MNPMSNWKTASSWIMCGLPWLRMRRVIVDRHNIIDANSVIGFDAEADRARYQVTPGGVVVIPKGRTDYFARDSRGSGLGYDE